MNKLRQQSVKHGNKLQDSPPVPEDFDLVHGHPGKHTVGKPHEADICDEADRSEKRGPQPPKPFKGG